MPLPVDILKAPPRKGGDRQLAKPDRLSGSCLQGLEGQPVTSFLQLAQPRRLQRVCRSFLSESGTRHVIWTSALAPWGFHQAKRLWQIVDLSQVRDGLKLGCHWQTAAV